MKTNSEMVREFTEQTSDIVLPNKPTFLTRDEVYFLSKMIIDETLELLATVDEPELAKSNLIDLVTNAKDVEFFEPEDVFDLVAEQADAMVDIQYYIENAATKKGINLCKIFEVVHQSNMDKRDSVTGKFIKRADGKIIKPQNWIEPNIRNSIIEQYKTNAFKGE
jgi:predicted HAD superfamily Cof-like phosphohydrolase